jgi:hypothetical protein
MAAAPTTPPRPRDLSPLVRVIIGGVLFIAAAIFILALHRPAATPRLKDLSDRGDNWWAGESRPTPAMAPRLPHVAVPRPIVFQPPQTTPPSILKPTPAPCPICVERQMRYQRAIETGMGAGSTNMRELPQMFAPVSTPQATPAPLVIQETAP